MPGPVEATSSTLEVAQEDSVCDKKLWKIINISITNAWSIVGKSAHTLSNLSQIYKEHEETNTVQVWEEN